MVVKHLVAGLACAGLLISGSAAPVAAGTDDVVGGLIGGMIGAAIINEANKQRPRTVVRQAAPKPAVSSYQREQNREVQTSLNYFGYPVGAPDGVIGAKSRAAIGQYQTLLGYPATGQLTEIERQILVTAYQRALIGGPQVQQVVAGPQGIRGMLLAQRDEMMGGAGGTYAANSYGGMPPEVSAAVDEIARNANVQPEQLIQRAGFIQLADMNADGRTDYLLDTSVTGSGFWCNGPACTVRVFASTPEGYQRNDFQLAGATPASFSCQHGLCQIAPPGTVTAVAAAPVPAAPAPAPSLPGATMAAAAGSAVALPAAPAAAMPSFAAAPAAPALPSFAAAAVPVPVSARAYCAAVKAKGGAAGAPQTVAALNDPAQALGEQFCLAEAEATRQGVEMAKGFAGFTPEQIAAQCRDFGALLADQVTALATTPRDDMIAAVQGWGATSGMTEAQLAGTAKVCLSVGYSSDDMGVALGSALVLAGTGNMTYAEFLGHHLAGGVGLAADPGLALDWYDLAGNAVAIGQTPVFGADQADRAALIHKAAMALAGRAETSPEASPVPVSATGGQGTVSGLAGFGAAAAGLMQKPAGN